MGILAGFLMILLAKLTTANTVIYNITFEYPETPAVYTADHDVVDIFCPSDFVKPKQEEDIESAKEMYGSANTIPGAHIGALFIQADVVNNDYHYKGLYYLRNKTATKILDNGRDIAGPKSRDTIFLAATDGIYVYNAQENSAVKYGTVSDSLIGIAVANRSDLYVLTKDRVLYKVTNNGTEKEAVSDVKGATQIVSDYAGNLYFLNRRQSVFVKKTDGTVVQIKGVPRHCLPFAKLIRPPLTMNEGLFYVAGYRVFRLLPNGPAELVNIILNKNKRPTAFSIDAVLFQYYAYKKKIYPFNLGAIMRVGTNFGFYLDVYRNTP